MIVYFFFFKQKTAYEMRISDWSSDVCSSDLAADGAPQVHDEAPGNLCYDWVMGDEAQVDAAFAKAHHVTRLDLINNRLIPNAMEPRAAIGEYDGGTDNYTLYSTSQNPHLLKLILCAFVFGLNENKLRV